MEDAIQTVVQKTRHQVDLAVAVLEMLTAHPAQKIKVTRAAEAIRMPVEAEAELALPE